MLVFSLLLFFLINVPLLKADTCSDSVKEAEDIEVTTKVETVKWEDNGGITSYNIYVIIKNITANTYVVVMNDLNDKVEYLGYEDSDNGVIKLKTYNPYKKISAKASPMIKKRLSFIFFLISIIPEVPTSSIS